MRCLRLTVLALAAVVLAPALSAAGSSSPKGPPTSPPERPQRLSAEEIVAKNVEARGGLEAWRKVDTMLWMGHIESEHAPLPSVQFMLAQQRPDKTHFEINAMGEKTLRVFDGVQGWKLHPVRGRPGVEPYSIQDVRFEQDGPGIEPLLVDYAAKGRSIELQGVDEIDKRKAYHLLVHTTAGNAQQVWVDAQTFLEVRYDRAVSGSAGASKTVSVVYRDYKDTDGLKIPSIIETGVGPGVAPDRMVIEKVVLNPRLDARTFIMPGARPKPQQQSGFPLPRRRSVSPGGGLPPALSGLLPPPAASAPAGQAAPPGIAAPPSPQASESQTPPAQDPGSAPR
jgi:hypothetical protein